MTAKYLGLLLFCSLLATVSNGADKAIYLANPVRTEAHFQGSSNSSRLLAAGQAKPLAMASGDFDADGIDDLAVGYVVANGGAVAVFRGNLDAFAPQSDGSFRSMARGQNPSPYLPNAQVVSIPGLPDFLAAGDFIGLGGPGVVAASRGGNQLFILARGQSGAMELLQTINVPGTITGVGAYPMQRGKYSQVVVGVHGPGGSELHIFSGAYEGLSEVSKFSLTSDATSFAFGNLDGDAAPDVLVVAGSISILHGASQSLEPVRVPYTVSAAALGNFVYDRDPILQMALRSSDGSVHILVQDTLDGRPFSGTEIRQRWQARMNAARTQSVTVAQERRVNWREIESYPGAGSAGGSGNPPVMFRSRVSGSAMDDVVLLSSAGLTTISHPDGKSGSGIVTDRSDLGRDTVAALSTRVSVSAAPGIVSVTSDSTSPSLHPRVGGSTFNVNTTDDTVDSDLNDGICADVNGKCSLRAAVMQANHDNNSDMINVPAGTYQLTLSGANKETAGETDTYGSLDIFASMTITGAVDSGGNPTTIVEAGTTTSNGIDKVFSVNPNGDQVLITSFSNLKIQFGKNPGSFGGGLVIPHGFGGGFFTELNGTGHTTLTNCIVTNNSTVDGDGGGIAVDDQVGGTGLFTMTGTTVSSNTVKESSTGAAGIGGGIWVGSATAVSISTSIIQGNLATQVTSVGGGNGGGIFLFNPRNTNHQSTIHGSLISANQAAGEGGGIFTGQGLLIDNTGLPMVISGNTAAQGGGVWSSFDADTTTINNATITGNTANGTGDPTGTAISGGGGVFSSSNGSTASKLVMHFSRLAGNSSTSGFGINLESLGTSGSTAAVTNNWWGTNAAATTIKDVSGSVTFDPFIVLTHTGSPQEIRISQSSTLTATIANDNHGNAVGLGNLTATIIGLPITFNGAVLGAIPQAQPETIDSNAQATATFNAGTTAGLGTANATVDQAVVPVNSNLIASATETGTTATITTVGAHGFSGGEFVSISGVTNTGYNGAFFKILSTPTSTSFTYTANTSGLGNSSGGTANAGIIILQPPSITKTFSPVTVSTGAASTITFSINNGNVVPINGSFTDSLPANVGTVPGSLVVANSPSVVNGCGGSVTATAGASSISFNNAAVPAGTCTVKVNVQSAVDNTYNNSVTIDSTDAGNGNTSLANLTVINPPAITKAFSAPTVPLNGTTTLTFTINNNNVNQTLNGIAFTDTLQSGLVVATPNNLTGACGGTAAAATGSTSVNLSGGTLAPGGNCTITVTVQGTTAGVVNNSVQVTSTNGGTGNTSSASLTVVGPPTISKAFAASSIPLNGTTNVNFTITNPNTTQSLTGVGFTDSLPSSLTVTSATSTVCGGTLTTTSPGTIVLSGATVAANNGTCLVSVTVTGVTAGTSTNTTAAPTSTEGGTGVASNTASIFVVAPPTIAKQFSPINIPVNTTTSLTFTLTNPSANTTAETGVAFVDTLPTGLTVASGTSNTCGGTLTTTAPTGVSLTGATIPTNGQCQFSVTVTGAVSGQYTNTTGTVSSTNGGTGLTASANLTVANPPTISKAFGATTIPLNGTTSLTFTIKNPNATVNLNGIAFSDTLPAGLVTSGTVTDTGCGGTASSPTSGTVTLTAGTLASGVQCTISVTVQGTTTGVKNNVTGAITSTEGGTGLTASASVTVVAPPTIAKAFGASSIPLNGTTSVNFTITNSNAVGLTGVGFTDSLPSSLTVTSGTSTVCGGTLTTTSPGTIALSGATVAANNGTCLVSVTVTGVTAGTSTNTAGAPTSTEGGTGVASNTASIFVVAPPTIAKQFTPSTIAVNGTTSLMFTLTNPSANTTAETGVAFVDTLPTGLTVANGTTNTCGGTLTTTAPTGISLTGATIATSGQCQFSVTVTGAVSGQYTNTTGTVSSTNGGTGLTASANLSVATPPSITKAFGATQIPVNGTTSLTFTIKNPNTNVTLTGLAFTDSLPSGLVTSGAVADNGCGGTASSPNSGIVSLSGGTLLSGAQCTVVVTIQGTTAGVKNNSVQITSNEGGTGNTSNASITVVAPPTIGKAFSAASVPLGGTATVTFSITNPNATVNLSGVAFTDTLPTGNATLVVAGTPAVSNNCGGTVTAAPGSGSISLSGGTVSQGVACTLQVNVQGTAAGDGNNITSAITSTEGGTGTTSNTAILKVVAPPAISKAFGASNIVLNGTTTLTFTITNPSANTTSENGIAFSDTLTNGLQVASPPNTSNNCGTVTAVANSTTISLTGGSITNPGATCTIVVNVTGTQSGQVSNTTSAITSTNGGTGTTSNTATLTVASPPAIVKQFGASSIPYLTSTSLSFAISNPNSSFTLLGVAFSDVLPAGLVVATPSGAASNCGGTLTAVAGSTSVTLSGVTLAGTAGCTVSLNVTGAATGVQTNSVTVTSTNAGAGNTSIASLTVNFINVTNSVTVTQTGFVRNRVTGVWSATMTVTNSGAVAINSPIEVVLSSLSSNATMTNNNGLYNGAPYAGSPYITVLNTGTLAPGGSVSVAIQFTNPTNGFITFTPVTFEGGLF